jgi:serine/threonine protein kinase
MSFGRYREIAQLGQGGMARVVLAALPGALGVQKLLVIKEMLPELAADPDFVAMFVDEARLATRLDHPNLIQTFEIGENGDRYFLVMEYLEGQPLASVLSRTKRKMPLPMYLHVLARVLAGLHYAHELTDISGEPLGIVHRDVSPGNVFLCYGGAIKLVDFGIAKMVGARVKTRTGVFKGKLGYASPEQIENLPIDRRTDIFAAGVLLWEGLVGRRITTDLSDASILHRRLLGMELGVIDEQPNAPPELAAICRKAMARSVGDRYATAAEMQAALEAYLDKSGERVSDRDVGAYVAGLFDQERSETRKLIQAHLEKPEAETVSEKLVIPQALSSRSSLSGDSGTEVSASIERRTGGSLTRRPGRGMLVGIGVAVAALAALGGALGIHRARVSTAAPTSSDTARPTASASAPRTIELSLTADPPQTRFTLDGTALEGNPVAMRVLADDRAHALRASAPGRQDDARFIQLDRDVHLELTLPVVAAAAPTESAAAGARPTTTAKHPRVAGPAKTRPTTTPLLGPPPVTTAKPLDTSDPWGGKK